MSYFTYILYSESAYRFYIGSSENVLNRLERHNSGKVASTKPFRPWKIVYTESFENRALAVAREKLIKRMKSRNYILQLIGMTRPDFNRKTDTKAVMHPDIKSN